MINPKSLIKQKEFRWFIQPIPRSSKMRAKLIDASFIKASALVVLKASTDLSYWTTLLLNQQWDFFNSLTFQLASKEREALHLERGRTPPPPHDKGNHLDLAPSPFSPFCSYFHYNFPKQLLMKAVHQGFKIFYQGSISECKNYPLLWQGNPQSLSFGCTQVSPSPL